MNGAAAEPFFVDTNVLLYALSPTDPLKNATAQRWLKLLWDQSSGRIGWQVLNEFYANAAHKFKVPKGTARGIVQGYIA